MSANDDVSPYGEGSGAAAALTAHVSERVRSDGFVVPKGYRIVGTMFAPGGVRIDGELGGRSLVSSRILVGPTGRLRAPSETVDLVVEGVVLAPVKARGVIEVRSGGQVRADVEGAALKVLPGGVVHDAMCLVGPKR